MIKDYVVDLAKRLTQLENEIKLLQDDRKELFQEFSDKLDVKAFKVAWSILKRIKNVDEDVVDNIVEIMKKSD